MNYRTYRIKKLVSNSKLYMDDERQRSFTYRALSALGRRPMLENVKSAELFPKLVEARNNSKNSAELLIALDKIFPNEKPSLSQQIRDEHKLQWKKAKESPNWSDMTDDSKRTKHTYLFDNLVNSKYMSLFMKYKPESKISPEEKQRMARE